MQTHCVPGYQFLRGKKLHSFSFSIDRSYRVLASVALMGIVGSMQVMSGRAPRSTEGQGDARRNYPHHTYRQGIRNQATDGGNSPLGIQSQKMTTLELVKLVCESPVEYFRKVGGVFFYSNYLLQTGVFLLQTDVVSFLQL